MTGRSGAAPLLATDPRVVVVGTTSSGKTTLAAQLAALLSIPHIELDALVWQPNWSKSPTAVVAERLTRALAPPNWVVDGNWSELRPIVWAQARTLVWLDYPLGVIYWRLAKRTLRRILTREVLWGSNRETLRGAFFSKDSLFLYAYPSRQRQRETYPRVTREEYPHLQVIRLRTPAETARWFDHLCSQTLQGTADEQRNF